jgi:hypothetical protein
MDGIIILNDEFDITTLNEDLYKSKLEAVNENFDRIRNMSGSDDLLFNKIQEL